MATLTEILYSDKGTLNFSPKRGLRYIIGKGNTPHREIFYGVDDPAPLLPITPLIPGWESVLKFPLQWTQLLPENKALAKGLVPILTFEKDIDKDGKHSSQRMAVVLRDEKTHFLFARETHAFMIDFLSEDSGALKFLFSYILNVESAMKVFVEFPAGNFLTVVETSLKAALSEIFRSMKFGDLRKIRDDKIKDQKTDIVKKLNQSFKKKGYGFKLESLFLEEVIVMPSSQDRVNNEEDVVNSELEAIAMGNRAKGEAEAIKKKGASEAWVFGEKLWKLFLFRKDDKAEINQTARIVSKNLSQLPGTIVGKAISGNESDSEFDALLTQMLIANGIQDQKQKQKGGTHAST